MGIGSSKSPLERRNTVARRSQRRSIHNLKAKVDKIFSDIKKFKGYEEDAQYKSIHSEIDHNKNDLMRKSRELQPQVKNIFDNTMQRIEEAYQALENKLKENQEKAQRREKEQQEKAEKKREKEKEKERKQKDSDVLSENNDVEVKEIEEDPKEEAEALEGSTEKRKTVELKFVQINPEEVTQADIHPENNNVATKSPEEKRKSILKVGVAVMPGAMMNEIYAKSNVISKLYADEAVVEHDGDDIIPKINDMIEQLQAIEYQIADFVGRKNGTQYNRIKDKLNHYLIELTYYNPTDDYTHEQIKICKNYVGSCMSFLDEKATEEKLQDDVFLPDNSGSGNLSPIDARMKLERLSKTTAI